MRTICLISHAKNLGVIIANIVQINTSGNQKSCEVSGGNLEVKKTQVHLDRMKRNDTLIVYIPPDNRCGNDL